MLINVIKPGCQLIKIKQAEDNFEITKATDYLLTHFLCSYSTRQLGQKEAVNPCQVQEVAWKTSEQHPSSNATVPAVLATTLQTNTASG